MFLKNMYKIYIFILFFINYIFILYIFTYLLLHVNVARAFNNRSFPSQVLPRKPSINTFNKISLIVASILLPNFSANV